MRACSEWLASRMNASGDGAKMRADLKEQKETVGAAAGPCAQRQMLMAWMELMCRGMRTTMARCKQATRLARSET